MVKSCRNIHRKAFIGDTAGGTMSWGIICFLASVLCLAIASQPPAVWAFSAVACSSILVFPLITAVMNTFEESRS